MVLKNIVYGDAKIVLDWLNTGRFGYVVQGDGCSCEEKSHRRPLLKEHYDQHAFSVEATTPGYVTFDGSLLQISLLIQTSDLTVTIQFILPFLSTALPFTSNQIWFPQRSGMMVWWTWCSPIFLLLGLVPLRTSLIAGY